MRIEDLQALVNLNGVNQVTLTKELADYPTIVEMTDELTALESSLNAAIAAKASTSFSTLAVVGQSNVVADAAADTLTLAAGSNITITTNASTDTVTIAAASGISDGDKGDITVSGSGATWTIDNDVVTYPKMQNVSATDRLLGRSTSGAGDIEEIVCTAAGRALLDDADNTAQRATLGLGTLATQNGTFSGTSSGTNTGDARPFALGSTTVATGTGLMHIQRLTLTSTQRLTVAGTGRFKLSN